MTCAGASAQLRPEQVTRRLGTDGADLLMCAPWFLSRAQLSQPGSLPWTSRVTARAACVQILHGRGCAHVARRGRVALRPDGAGHAHAGGLWARRHRGAHMCRPTCRYISMLSRHWPGTKDSKPKLHLLCGLQLEIVRRYSLHQPWPASAQTAKLRPCRFGTQPCSGFTHIAFAHSATHNVQ